MSEKKSEENKMGTMEETRLLLNMSLPIMLSMLVMACYNIVDSIFVSQISQGALSAISLAFPIQTLMIAVSIGTSVGVTALLSMRLGEKKQDEVNKIAVNGIFLAFCSSLVFVAFSTFGIIPYLRTQTDSPEIISMGNSYLTIIMAASLPSFFGAMLDRLLQSTGRTIYTMITQLIGAITNIILDPILIFGIGPFPRMGMAGAAAATVIGQTAGAAVSFIFNMRVNRDIHYKFRGFRPDPVIIGQIYKIGIPTILLQSINSVTTYGMNLVLGTFRELSDTAIAVYGTYFKLNSFIFMPVFGLTSGMVPIVAFNFGARNRHRMIRTFKATLKIAALIMCAGVLAFELFPDWLLRMFNASNEMLEIGTTAFRIIAPSFFGAAIGITCGAFLQAIGKAFNSMIISFVRQLVVLLPVAYLFSRTGILANVWYCFLIAEIFAICLSLFFVLRQKRKILDRL